MPKALYAEATIEVDGEPVLLALDFAAIDAIESLTDVGFDATLAEVQGDAPKHGLVGKLLWGLTRRHHPEFTLEQAAGIMYGASSLAAGAALQQLLEAAFARADDGGEGKSRPRKPRGTSRPS